jgi:nitroreductase
VYLEAGHATQNLLLQATALGLAAVPLGDFVDEWVARGTPLPEELSPIYLVPVGYPG